MAVRTFGNVVLVRAVPQTLFEETIASNLPGIFGGKLDLNALPAGGDLVKITLDVRYVLAGAYVKAEDTTFTQSDEIFRFTPVEESYGYRLTIELLAASPSAGATLAFVITRSPIA